VALGRARFCGVRNIKMEEKKYTICWDEIVRKSIIIQAKNKEEAIEKFYNSNCIEAEEIENEFVDGSLEVEEE
jgi:hypothetical protein